MKNLISQLTINIKSKFFVGIFIVLIVLSFSSTSSAFWVSGHPYYIDAVTDAQVSLDYGYDLQFIWINPSDNSVNILGGYGSSNPVYYALDGSYSVEFPDDWGDRLVYIGTYPRSEKDAAYYASYHPGVTDFGKAETFMLEETTFNPGSVGKEIIERPVSIMANIHGSLIFPKNDFKNENNTPVVISLYQNGTLLKSYASVKNIYNITANPNGIYKLTFSKPGYKSESVSLEIVDGTLDIIKNVTMSDSYKGGNNGLAAPENYSLSQNYPNPFNPTTTISFGIPKAGMVTLKVFDISGKEVSVLLNEFRNEGNYSVNFNASNLSSGIYFYSLQINGNTITKKLTLLK